MLAGMYGLGMLAGMHRSGMPGLGVLPGLPAPIPGSTHTRDPQGLA